MKNYRKMNADKIKLNNKSYYFENKEVILLQAKKYSILNREKINNRQKTNVQNNPHLKLAKNTRRIINQFFKNNNIVKECRTTVILGCPISDFKNYIEAKFEPWMNWDNYGNPKDGIYELNKTWDVDHIIPVSFAKNKEEVIKLNHYTNLQPLCSYRNRWIKNNKI
jgi:hypothetical protein